MIDPALPQSIVRHFDFQTTQPIVGGLSGARIWRCRSASREFCVRRWPTEHPTIQRLHFMHQLLQLARQAGLQFVPQLYNLSTGQSYELIEQHLWEVTQWLPGSADYLESPSEAKLFATIQAIASLHQAWSNPLTNSVPMQASQEAMQPSQDSPAVVQRIERLEYWLGKLTLGSKWESLCSRELELQLGRATLRSLQRFGEPWLRELQAARKPLSHLQPVLRDVWSDHILFVGDRVTGIVDYGAMRIDEPETDLARLLGSLEPLSLSKRKSGVEFYMNCLPDSSISWQRVELLDRTSTLLIALQWFEWLVLERREFAAPTSQLIARWQNALARVTQFE